MTQEQAIEFTKKINDEISGLKGGLFVQALREKVGLLRDESNSKRLGKKYTPEDRERDMGMVDGINYVLSQIEQYSEMDLQIKEK